MKRGFCCIAALIALGVFYIGSASAQVRPASDSVRSTEDQAVVLSALRTAISIIQDITRRHATAPIAEQLQVISGRMGGAADGYGGFRDTSDGDNSEDLSELLLDIRTELRSIRQQLTQIGEQELADRLSDSIDDLRRAVRVARALEMEATPTESERLADSYEPRENRRGDGNRRSWDDSDENDRRIKIRVRDSGTDNRRRSDGRREPFWRDHEFNWHRHSSAFVGEYSQRWPYRETALYRPIPANRYNRVEGLVLGVGRSPMDWSDRDGGRIFGQIAYAFSLEDWRYEVGAETKLTSQFGRGDFGLKIGGVYRENTATNDLWKSNWAENSLAAGLFRFDFFDYFEIEGWTAYLVGMVTPFVQFSVGFRDDEYRSMANETNWSLFGGDPFRFNPAIEEGQMRSVVTSLEGGRVRGFRYLPSGIAFRFSAELGKHLGGDFAFNRYEGDLRSYARMSRTTGFSLRLRGGYAEGNVPVQKGFTLGGIGSVRAYSQNVLYGTRMLLANAEYTMYQPGFFGDFLDDMAFFGLIDAGWTNLAGTNEFKLDDVFSAAGFGVSFDDRNIRLEIAWPLRDMGAGKDATLWLRLNPTF